VWAIDEEHAVNYYFPRDCPRVVYSRYEGMPRDLQERFFAGTAANTVIWVESGWLERIRGTRLYRYAFEPEPFRLLDAVAGYYVAERTVKLVSVEPLDDLLGLVAASGAELRITPNLHPIRDLIVASGLTDFSIIRFRNAAPPPGSPD
jgi:hypothetical protein